MNEVKYRNYTKPQILFSTEKKPPSGGNVFFQRRVHYKLSRIISQ
jgi:hypothetical protein